jgi:4-hydroxythreonine-4-phosphate dehydrogenase
VKLPLLGCSMGDPAGIGPEILLAAAAELGATGDRGAQRSPSTAKGPRAACLFLGDAAVFATYAQRLKNIDLPLTVPSATEARAAADKGQPGPFLLECAPVPAGLVPGQPRPVDGAAALAAIQTGARLAAIGAIDALVTAPLSKHGVAAHEPGFKGHTEFLAALDSGALPVMLFAAPRPLTRATPSPAVDIALLTTHLPLVTAIAMVRPAIVEAGLRRLHDAWGSCFGREPVIGVAALNPHAGEHGAIGGEEPRVLAPAIRAVADDGIDARGPYPADSIFLRGELDVILALYHDQGTIMAKRAPWPTVNLTLGLSYVRTSPDHGTAYDLAGAGRADHQAMLAALRMAAQLVIEQ